jgi:cell division transport system ATP-binding protein
MAVLELPRPRLLRRRGTPPPAPVAARPRPPRRLGPPLVEFHDVAVRYGVGSVGLDGATFTIRRGEMVFLVGPTGSGKSTIMRLLIKELEPTAGTIRVAGRVLGAIPRRKVPYYRRNVGVVFQDFKLLPARTVYENVAYALQVTGGSRREIRDKVPDVLRMTGLSTKLHSYPHELSGGEQQRVAVARAFVNHPPLLLADEPTGNLDPQTSIGIMQLLYRINRTGTTVLVATHDSELVDKMRRRVIELEAGRVVRDEAAGRYARLDETTREFAARLRSDLRPGEARPGDPPAPEATGAVAAGVAEEPPAPAPPEPEPEPAPEG